MAKAHTKHLLPASLLIIGGITTHLFPSPLPGAALITAAWLIGAHVNHTIPHTPLTTLLAYLGFISLASLLIITADPELTQTSVAWLWQSIAAFYLTLILAQNPAAQKLMALSLTGMAVALALAAPLITNWGKVKITIIPTQIYQLLPTIVTNTVHPNTMATALLLLLPLPLAWTISHLTNRAWHFWLALAATALISTTFLLTQSRAGYIALALSIIPLLWLLQWKKSTLIFTLCIVTMLTVLIGASTVIPPNNSELITTATNTGTFEFRLRVWEQALNLTKDFAFTGTGMGAFNEVSSRLYPFYEPNDPGAHNLFLHIGAEMGLPTLIVYFAILLNLAIFSYKLINSQIHSELKTITIGLTVGLLGYHLHGLFDNTLWPTRLAFLPWLLIGLLTAIYIYTLANHTNHSKLAKE